jgi:hypothetical protein
MTIPKVVDFSINDESFAAENAHIVALSNGQYDVAWAEGSSIRIERFDADGTSLGALPLISGFDPSMAAQGNVRALAVVQSPSASEKAVVVNFYNGNGFGPSLTVDSSTSIKYNPEICLLANGMYAIAWVDAAAKEIRARVYDPFTGSFVTNVITVSTTPSTQEADDFDVGLEPLSNGNFAVSWRADSANEGHFRVVEPSGAVASNDMIAGTGRTDVVQLSNGTIAVTTEGGGAIYNESGTQSIGSIAQGGGWLTTTSLADGRLLIASESGFNSETTITGYLINPDGSLDESFIIGQGDPLAFWNAHIDTLADGRIVFVSEFAASGNYLGLHGSIIDAREFGVQLAGTSQGDHFVGTDFNDTSLWAPAMTTSRGPAVTTSLMEGSAQT